MFTANPLTKNRNEIVVTANYGLGESVVSDIASPDCYYLHRDGRPSKAFKLGEKDKMVIPNGNGTAVVQVSPTKSRQRCLTNKDLLLLAKLAIEVENHYRGTPQDMEFAFGGSTLYLLQSRPITTLQRKKPPARGTMDEFNSDDIDEHDWVSTANAQEMFPGPATPLTISIFGAGIEYGMQKLHSDFGVLETGQVKLRRLRMG